MGLIRGVLVNSESTSSENVDLDRLRNEVLQLVVRLGRNGNGPREVSLDELKEGLNREQIEFTDPLLRAVLWELVADDEIEFTVEWNLVLAEEGRH